MKYETEKSFVDELDLDSEPMSLEEMNRYMDEYATEEDWDEDFLNEDWDDFDKIDRKVEEFSARIAELEEELSNSWGLSSELEVLEYKIYVLDEQRDILLGHKDILMGVPGTPNDVVFAEAQKMLDNMRLLEAAKWRSSDIPNENRWNTRLNKAFNFPLQTF